MFTVNHVFPEIRHITDNMGVGFTLIEGADRAILFDTGYGMENVQSFISELTEKPVTVYLSHGHHDHVLGARWFDTTYLCAEDMEEFRERTGEGQRQKVSRQAAERGVSLPDDFMTARIAQPGEIRFTERTGPYDSLTEELGDLEVKVIKVPGHTPGSIVLYIPPRRLLLSGDDWNPCTWMWFPSSCAANLWRDRMKILTESLGDYGADAAGYVLCSHQPMLRDGNELKGFLDYMTDERMKTAPGIDMGAPINTHEIRSEENGWQLIFDYDKL